MTPRCVPALLLLAACSSLQPVPLEYITDMKPPVVQISDGYILTEIAQPRLSGDSVVGMSLTGDREVSIPLRHVQQISTVRFNGGRTALLIGSLAAMGALATYAFLTTGNDPPALNCDIAEPRDVHEREQCGFTLTVGR